MADYDEGRGQLAQVTLIKKDGMLVMSENSLGRFLVRHQADVGRLTMITRDNQPTAVLVPYEIWFQVQHFISTVISRET